MRAGPCGERCWAGQRVPCFLLRAFHGDFLLEAASSVCLVCRPAARGCHLKTSFAFSIEIPCFLDFRCPCFLLVVSLGAVKMVQKGMLGTLLSESYWQEVQFPEFLWKFSLPLFCGWIVRPVSPSYSFLVYLGSEKSC